MSLGPRYIRLLEDYESMRKDKIYEVGVEVEKGLVGALIHAGRAVWDTSLTNPPPENPPLDFETVKTPRKKKQSTT